MARMFPGRPGPVTVVALMHPGSGSASALAGTGAAVLHSTTDVAAAASAVERFLPMVALVDLSAALSSGPSAGSNLLVVVERMSSLVPVLAVSGSADHTQVLAVVEAGATGYLVGPLGSARLQAALIGTAAGDPVFSHGLADLVLAEEAERALPGTGNHLTEREAAVLRLIVEGLTTRQIATRLVLSARTVENHVQNVLRKLGLPNRASLVRHAVENGLT